MLGSFQSLSLAWGFAISFSVSLQTEQSTFWHCELFRSHMFVGFAGRGEVVLNPWPAQHTEEWQGAQLKTMEGKGMKPSFILLFEQNQQSELVEWI